MIKYPVLCTPKLDGVRCIVHDGRALTRTFKPVPNKYIREFIEANYPDGVDGELMVPNTGGTAFDAGPITRHTGEPAFEFYCFDYVVAGLDVPYQTRMDALRTLNLPRLERVVPKRINNEVELLAYERECLADGYEGVMLRSPSGPYKLGRSTTREGYLLKLKRFVDSEAVILACVEQLHNANAATEDAFGRTKRSSHAENKIGKATLGAFAVRDLKTGVEFNIGTGMDDAFRLWAWQHQAECVGKIGKYKSQAAGAKDAPRFPVWLGFRDPVDM
jgi:DNA ligase-1